MDAGLKFLVEVTSPPIRDWTYTRKVRECAFSVASPQKNRPCYGRFFLEHDFLLQALCGYRDIVNPDCVAAVDFFALSESKGPACLIRAWKSRERLCMDRNHVGRQMHCPYSAGTATISAGRSAAFSLRRAVEDPENKNCFSLPGAACKPSAAKPWAVALRLTA